MDDDGGGGQWLSYAQLAEMRGITRKAAIRMTQRHRWRRQPGNDGTALVWVHHDDLTPRQPSRQTPRQTPDDDRDTTPFHAQALAALEDAVAAVQEAKDSEIATLHGVIDGLRASIARAEDRAGRVEADRDAERARADQAIRRADAADEDRRTAQTLADQSMALLADVGAAITEERRRADARRAQIDALNAELVAARAEVDPAMADERVRADALRTAIDELKAGQALMVDMHAKDLATAQDRLERVRDAAEALRRGNDARRARGLVARLRAAWRGE